MTFHEPHFLFVWGSRAARERCGRCYGDLQCAWQCADLHTSRQPAWCSMGVECDFMWGRHHAAGANTMQG